MTRRSAPARGRSTRDPYGIGPASSYIGPAIALAVLVMIALVTVSLFNGQIPLLRTNNGNGGGNGDGNGGGDPNPTAAPSNIVVTDPGTTFPGSIVYAKAGNIWIQAGKDARQLTNTGQDSMPSFSTDGQWVYFIRITETTSKFPTGGFLSPSWYDLETPSVMRVHPDGTGSQRLIAGTFVKNSARWFYWLRQPVPSPDGKTVTVISDGPNPLQGDITLHTLTIATKKLTSLNLPESLQLGHQDPAWRADGKVLLYVKNGRELTRGAPQIFGYDPATKKTRALTGPGYTAPAFSPDGKWVAATKTDAFGTDIAVLDSAGKEVLRVTDDGHSFSPVWSPAGDAIAFLHLQGTIVDLSLARLDHASGRWTVSETVAITKVSGLDGASRPSWYAAPSELPPGSPDASPAASAAP